MDKPHLYSHEDLIGFFHSELEKQIENALKHDTNEESFRSPIESIVIRSGLESRAEVAPAISSFPEILFGEIFDKDLRQFVRIEQSSAFHSTNGVLLCHALSPHKESLGLLLELGRASRFSRIFNIKKHIMLAGPLWGSMNWVVKDLGAQHNLHACLDYRKRIYEKLKFTYDICDLDKIGDGKSISSATELDLLSHSYEKLCLFVWGKDVANGRVEKKIAERLIDNISINVKTSSQISDSDLLQIIPVKNSLKFHITAITTVLRRLRRIDYETFKYFFLQRHFQLNYSGFVKLAVSREQDFDKPFALLNEIEKIDDYSLSSIYFDDYYYHKDSDGAATVHPYYFPSGTLYEKYTDANEAEKFAIMVDSNETHIKQRLINISDDRIIISIVSDMLFFAAELLQRNTRAIDEIAKALKVIVPEFGINWKKQTKSLDGIGRLCRTWGDLAFTRYIDKIEVPFFIYPGLIFYLEKDTERKKEVAKIYSKVFSIIINELHKSIKMRPNWES